jgi:hypothetical protein
MSAKTAGAYKKLGQGFSNEEQMVKLTYNFAVDGGATTDTYRLAKVNDKILVTDAIVHVETACAGSGAVVTIGAETADADGFLDATSGAVANLVDDFTEKEATGQKLVIGAGDYITLAITTGALTAGKINLVLKYVNIA